MLTEKSYPRVTLSLDIIKKITEGSYAGYHELNTIKHQISLFDVIEIEISDRMRIQCDDSSVPCDSTNLCWKAAELLKDEYGIEECVSISIEKHIPVRGGLAGGSANAATVLNLLNKLWNLNVDFENICRIGRKIGMDIPFYFAGRTAFDTEATAVLEPIETQVIFDFILLIPDFGISTADAYIGLQYNSIAKNTERTAVLRKALINNDRISAIKSMHNDFERTLFKKYPKLREAREDLLRGGCLNVVLSGSGSTLVGIAEDKEHARSIIKRISGNCVEVSSRT